MSGELKVSLIRMSYSHEPEEQKEKGEMSLPSEIM